MARKTRTEVATTAPKRSLIAKMAEDRGVEAGDFYKTVTETMFKGASQSQLMTLLLVADRYHLDVTTKEIFAFPAQGGGIVPVVSIDGWISLANQHPQFDGEEIIWADKWVEMSGGKRCPEWCEIRVYRKDRARPTVVREYLDEVFRGTPTWKSHTKRMLRHKTMIQGYRVAFGFSGIKDEDEALRIRTEGADTQDAVRPSSVAAAARQALGATPAPPEPKEAPESPPVDVDEVTGEVIEEYDVRGHDEPPIEEAEFEDAEVEEEAAEQQSLADLADLALKKRESKDGNTGNQKATSRQCAAIVSAAENNGWSAEALAGLLGQYDAGKPEDLSRENALEVVRVLVNGPSGDD